MKKQSVIYSTIRKAAIQLAFCGILLLNGMISTNAQDVKEELPTVSIRYAGTINDRPLFRIEFQNETEATLNVSIRDEENNVLYSERVKNKTFAKSFLVQDIDLDQMKLSFTINNDREKHSQVFEINKSVRTVQEYVITKR